MQIPIVLNNLVRDERRTSDFNFEIRNLKGKDLVLKDHSFFFHAEIKMMAKVWILLFVAMNGVLRGDGIAVVDLRRLPDSDGRVLAVQAAAGLVNRGEEGSVYVIRSKDDEFWKNELLENEDLREIHPKTFLMEQALKHGVVAFKRLEAPITLPLVVTIAGVLGAVPAEEGMLNEELRDAKVRFDARGISPSRSLRIAEEFLQNTTSLAIQKIDALMSGSLVDWIVKEKLFTTFMARECIPFTSEHKWFKKIVSEAPWDTPVKIFGYNSEVKVFGGYVFEAETNCINTLGQVATASAHNLAFWSGRGRIEQPLQVRTSQSIEYDPTKKYIALVYGDLDNISFVQGFARNNMLKRSKSCNGTDSCFPLTWTMSPQLLEVGPEMIRWYFLKAFQSGNDSFIFPPSGVLYSYPSLFPDAVKEDYLKQMDRAAFLMNTTGSIHWEWTGDWPKAFVEYFPRFSGTRISSFFLNNVPWRFPVLDMAVRGENFRILEGNVIAFKPLFNWAPGNSNDGNDWTPEQVARKLSHLKPGSIHYIYVIQTTEYEKIVEMQRLLPDDCQLVDTRQLASLALQKQQHQHQFLSSVARQT